MPDTDVRDVIAGALVTDDFPAVGAYERATADLVLSALAEAGLVVVAADSVEAAIHWAEKGLAATPPSLKVPFADAFMADLRAALPATKETREPHEDQECDDAGCMCHGAASEEEPEKTDG